jgi:hypothetical protein
MTSIMFNMAKMNDIFVHSQLNFLEEGTKKMKGVHGCA